MIILGIDPGYAIVGFGVIKYEGNHFTTLKYGAITTPAGMPFGDRLSLIFDGMNEIFSQFKIDWAVDQNGNHVELDKIDFVKIYTAVNQNVGWMGEISTEVMTVEDLHFEN